MDELLKCDACGEPIIPREGHLVQFCPECEEFDPDADCLGHPADEYSPMGVTQYCDGNCRKENA